MSKELKDTVRIMCHQIQNINKKTEITENKLEIWSWKGQYLNKNIARSSQYKIWPGRRK